MKNLQFSLRAALDDFEARSGIKLSYDELAEMAEVSLDTIKSVASRRKYNVTFQTVNAICNALSVNPIDHLEWTDDKS